MSGLEHNEAAEPQKRHHLSLNIICLKRRSWPKGAEGRQVPPIRHLGLLSEIHSQIRYSKTIQQTILATQFMPLDAQQLMHCPRPKTYLSKMALRFQDPLLVDCTQNLSPRVEKAHVLLVLCLEAGQALLQLEDVGTKLSDCLRACAPATLHGNTHRHFSMMHCSGSEAKARLATQLVGK